MKNLKTLLLILLTGILTYFAGCKDGATNAPPQNTTPVADAGPDLATNVCQLAELDGSGSIDADGDSLTYSWSIVSGPEDGGSVNRNLDLGDYFVATASGGTYEIELTVSDGEASDTDVTVITVPEPPVIELKGAIKSDSTLTDIWSCNISKVDYFVTDPVTVQNGATLTIEAGVRMAFSPNTYIEIGRTSPSSKLLAQGTGEKPIIMTADSDSPQPGHWAGLTFWGNTHPDTYLSYTQLEYCGQGQKGCLWAYGGSVGVKKVVILNSGSYGVNLSPPGAVGTFAAGSEDLTVVMSALNPIRIHPNEAGTLPEGSFFDDNNNLFDEDTTSTILVTKGTVGRTQTWPNLGIPYEISDNVLVMGANNPILTLLPGTELLFGDGAYLEIGRGDGGVLQAVGTADNPILFSSASPDPKPGDWGVDGTGGGIAFWSDAANGNKIDYAVIEYATDLVWYFNDIGVIVTNSTLRNASDCAFRWYPSADHTTDQSGNNTFANNAGGNQCED